MLRHLLLCLALASTGAVADTSDTADTRNNPELELAVQLMALMDMDSMLDAMHQQLETMLSSQMAQIESCEAMQPAIQAYSRDMTALITTQMSAETFIPEIAQVYVDVFTLDELQGLLDFYRSPLGEKMLAKMPELMQRSMAISEQQMTALMPEIEAAARRLGEEIEAGKSQCDDEAD